MNPIVIIGAGRSGTNMLRDALCALPDLGTWPCDEINYIWRYGNAQAPTDELTPEHARPVVVRYIRGQFRAIARRQRVSTVVEKTCANSLRVPFVDAVVPEARFVHIIRDGRDVVASAMQRWGGALDVPYVMRKARYVPVRDLPFYARRYLGDRWYKLSSGEHRLGAWGPRFEGMREALDQLSIAEVCALQWQRCVELASTDLADLPTERVHTLRYEAFVANPSLRLAELCEALGADVSKADLDAITSTVSARSVGNWRRHLAEEDIEAVERRVGPTLEALGYHPHQR